MTLILFDIDGTLVLSGEIIKDEMIEIIKKLYKKEIILGLVGGGSLEKIKYQMADSIKYFKYIFAECGAIVIINNKIIHEKNMLEYCNRDILNNIIKKALMIISNMPIIYHGNQIDFRKGLIYVSPPGMQATKYEREYFIEEDKKNNLRKKLIEGLKEIDDKNFEITYGGSVGVAIYPIGWNKSQVMNYLDEEDIYYYGDRIEPEGNDYPIYSHPNVNGVGVIDYKDTINKLKNFL